MKVVLGVDGGNTKTLAAVVALGGELVAVGRGGPSDVYGASSPEVAVRELYRVVEEALAHAGVAPEDVAAAGLSLAGADWEEDYELHREAAAAGLPGVPVTIVNDAVGPIRCLGRDGAAASLMCGTGAAIGARGADGRLWSLGFTPRSGGAGGLGREALSAVQEADMGCGPPTALTERLLHVVGVASPRALLHEFSRRGGLTDVAALAPHVLATALEGDVIAGRVVDAVGRRMGCWARHAAAQVGIVGPCPVLIGGGVVPLPGAERLIAAALAEVPEARPVELRSEPVLGAVLLGLDRAGATVDEAALLALTPTALAG